MEEAARQQESRIRRWARGQARAYPFWLRLIGWMGYGRMMRRAIADLPGRPRDVLDVGTGTGAAARIAGEAYPGARVVALDLSPEFLAEARRGEADRFRFVQGSAGALPVKRGTFDLAMSFGVLCHTADAGAVIREMRRVLRPGGCAVLWTRGRGPSGQALRWAFPVTSGGARFYLYSRRELRRLFEAAGFTQVRVSGEAHGVLVKGRAE
jgi:malonyl-CoA O-methyltransferase